MKKSIRRAWVLLPLLASFTGCSSLKKNSEGEPRDLPEGKFTIDVRGHFLKLGNPYVRVRPLDPAWRETKFESSSRQERFAFLVETAKQEASKDCHSRSMIALFPSEPVEVTTVSAVSFKSSPPHGVDVAFSCEAAPSHPVPTPIPVAIPRAEGSMR